ncbi:hypothetical protein [uncultured Methanobrevibacter sp.]|uniref:hypothetical protein n=1 Tax=uncultured Methanobrevibacter sp. TaxID=253161 RepID=UPI0025D011B7|nr:hypothetical protein [uncultured Methanobrevibacter sp.]
MSSLSTEIIEKAIDHAIKKNIERERNQIFQDGKAKGKIEGKIEEKERIAKTLKNTIHLKKSQKSQVYHLKQ